MSDTQPLLGTVDLVKDYPVHGGLRGGRVVHAVDGVSLSVSRGEVLAVVGESGSGKSTLGLCILGLVKPTSGSILLDGRDVTAATGRSRWDFRRRVQPVFQDPYSSLDPRWSIWRTIREPLDALRIGRPQDRDQRVRELLDLVGLSQGLGQRRPHELSGGQRQRVGIAAALAPKPELLVADEPVSALDVSVQAQILNLLSDLQRELALSVVFISHDLSVVEHISHRVAVMYLGMVVEEGPTRAVFDDPVHPYARALLDAIPRADPSRRAEPTRLTGEISSAIDPPSGCRFHPRCPLAEEACSQVEPQLADYGGRHTAACHVAARARLLAGDRHSEIAVASGPDPAPTEASGPRDLD